MTQNPKRNQKRALSAVGEGVAPKGLSNRPPSGAFTVQSLGGDQLRVFAEMSPSRIPMPRSASGHSTLCDVSFLMSVTWLSFDSDGAQQRSRQAPLVWLDADSRCVRASRSGNATAPDAPREGVTALPCPGLRSWGGPQPSSLKSLPCPVSDVTALRLAGCLARVPKGR